MTDVLVNTVNPAFYETPKAFDSVGVNITDSINPFAVVNRFVGVSVVRERPIGVVIVRKNASFGSNVVRNEWNQVLTFGVLNLADSDAATTLNSARNNSLIARRWTLAIRRIPIARLAANISFVNFDFAGKRIAVRFIQHATDLLAHTPRGFVGDARLPFDLFGRNSATSGRHNKDRVKPRSQGRAGFVINSVRTRINVFAARIASVCTPVRNSVVGGYLAAFSAIDAVGVKVILEPLQARTVSREFTLKILERVFGHWRFFSFGSHLQYPRFPKVFGY